MKVAAHAQPLGSPPLALGGSSSRRLIAAAIEIASPSGTTHAAPPLTSRSDELSKTTAGVPQAIASSGGNPKPSYADVKTNTSAARVQRDEVVVGDVADHATVFGEPGARQLVGHRLRERPLIAGDDERDVVVVDEPD